MELSNSHRRHGEHLRDEALYPVMPDENGCLPTAISYGLNKLGQQISPQEVDKVLGRKKGELPDPDHPIVLRLWLLDQGYQVEDIYMPNSINMKKYFSEESTLTYSDYVTEMLEIYGDHLEEYFTVSYTESTYLKDMANRREKDKLFDPALASGQYTVTREALSPHRMAELLSEGVVVAKIHTSSNLSTHAVVVENIAKVDKYLLIDYFNPNVQESEIAARYIESLDELIAVGAGIMVVRS